MMVLILLTFHSIVLSGWLIEDVDLPGIDPSLALNSAGYPDHDLRYAGNDGTGISQGYEEADYNLLCGYLHPNPTFGMTSFYPPYSVSSRPLIR